MSSGGKLSPDPIVKQDMQIGPCFRPVDNLLLFMAVRQQLLLFFCIPNYARS